MADEQLLPRRFVGILLRTRRHSSRGLGSGRPSRRASAVAAASTAAESRPPEKLTRHGGRRSAGRMARSSACRGEIRAVPPAGSNRRLDEARLSPAAPCPRRCRGSSAPSRSRFQPRQLVEDGHLRVILAHEPCVRGESLRGRGDADGDGARLAVGRQPALTHQRTLEAGVLPAAKPPNHAADRRCGQCRRRRQFDVPDLALVRARAALREARCAPTTQLAGWRSQVAVSRREQSLLAERTPGKHRYQLPQSNGPPRRLRATRPPVRPAWRCRPACATDTRT